MAASPKINRRRNKKCKFLRNLDFRNAKHLHLKKDDLIFILLFEYKIKNHLQDDTEFDKNGFRYDS
jgi:hypothetical protein